MFLFSVSPACGYQITVTPRISVGEEYTDNHFLTKDNKTEEYITTISPGLTAKMLGKTNGAEISYNPTYVSYDKYSENNTWRQNAQFLGWSDITRNIRLEIRDSFLLTEETNTNREVGCLSCLQFSLSFLYKGI